MKARPQALLKFEDHVIDLNLQWQMVRDLYGSKENLEVLENAGPNFWTTLEVYLVDHLLSSISRFFDPARSKSQQNLSIEQIIELPEIRPIRGDLVANLERLRAIWKDGIELWRHKKLSHTDMSYALGEKALPEIPVKDIEDLVNGISEIAHRIHLDIFGMDNQYAVVTSRWVPEVIVKLKAGIQHYEKEH